MKNPCPAILLLLFAAPALASSATPTPTATATATATPTVTPTAIAVPGLAYNDVLAIDRAITAMLAFEEPWTFTQWAISSTPVGTSAVKVIARNTAQLDPPCLAPSGNSPTNDITCAAGPSTGGAPSPLPTPGPNGLIPGGTVYCFTTPDNKFLAQTSDIYCAAANPTNVWAARRAP